MMETTAEDPEVVFDPLVEGFADSPYEQYARLRVADPVHRSELLQGWVVTRSADVGKLLRDPEISSSIHNATPNPLTIAELAHLAEQPRAGRTIVLLDDPDHARIRALMTEPFRPRDIEKLRTRITERVHGTLDRLREVHGAGRVEFDLVADFAYPLPVEIFSEMLGVPEEHNPQFRYWTQCVARTVDPIMSAEERAVCLQGLDEMYAYLEGQAAEKRAHPASDLLTALVEAEVDGAGLSHEDLMAQLVTLYMAGHEPTAALIGSGTLALLRAPEQLARLRAEPGLLRNAVSEFLRFDGPNHFVRRITTRPTLVGDVELPAGAVIYASPAAGATTPTDSSSTARMRASISSSVRGCMRVWVRISRDSRPRSRSPRSSNGWRTSSWRASRCGARACSSARSPRFRLPARSRRGRTVPEERGRATRPAAEVGVPAHPGGRVRMAGTTDRPTRLRA
jgi:cytochrome P450